MNRLLPRKSVESGDKLERIGKSAVRKNFSPEFINRIDSVVTYQPLDSAALTAILDQQIEDLQDHIQRRLGERAFHIEVPARSRKFLLEKGTSRGVWRARAEARLASSADAAAGVDGGGRRDQSGRQRASGGGSVQGETGFANDG